MIKVFKIVNDIYDGKVAPTLHYNNTSVTRDNKFKLRNQTFTHNLRKYFFSARIVNIWNSLPNWVVDVQDTLPSKTNTVKATVVSENRQHIKISIS